MNNQIYSMAIINLIFILIFFVVVMLYHIIETWPCYSWHPLPCKSCCSWCLWNEKDNMIWYPRISYAMKMIWPSDWRKQLCKLRHIVLILYQTTCNIWCRIFQIEWLPPPHNLWIQRFFFFFFIDFYSGGRSIPTIFFLKKKT